MLQRIVVDNFKSLRHVELRLGRMNLFLGSNASGKSNFFDALRLLQGIGSGFTVQEILDGKPKSSTSEIWDGIRGGSQHACFEGAGSAEDVGLTIEGGLDETILRGATWTYQIAFSPRSGRVNSEKLTVGSEPVYDTTPAANAPDSPSLQVRYWPGKKGAPPFLAFERTRSVLAQIGRGTKNVTEEHAQQARDVARALADMQRVDPSPMVLRLYSQAHRIERMGERGENFAALIRVIADEPRTKEAYLTWLRQLRPDSVDDVGIIAGALQEPMFVLHENGRAFPAPVLSDGTLRFAAITAALFQPDMPSMMMIEELENGIHPDRLRLLLELLRSRANFERPQLMATTHSPTVLSWLTDNDHSTTFFCKRDDDGASRICPLASIPHFREVAEKQPLADLLTEGWLEAAL